MKISYIYKDKLVSRSFVFLSNYESIIEKIQKSAEKHGYDVYIVGGFVRDMLLGRTPKDLDIMVYKEDVVSPGIEFAIKLSMDLNLHEPVRFPRFGTAQVIIDGKEVEFVMPRKEYYMEDSRKPDVELASLEQDALRRDFGINSLFLNLKDFTIVDLTNHGLEDIENKVIQVTDLDNQDIIFHQDPLRMLRAIRLAYQLDFYLSNKVIEGIKTNVYRISIISKERIRDELIKILICFRPGVAIKMLQIVGLLKIILPEINDLEIDQPTDYHHKNILDHSLGVLDNISEVSNDLNLRLAALFHDVGKPKTKEVTEGSKVRFLNHENIGSKITEQVLSRLKFSNTIIDTVKFLVKEHMYPHFYNDSWSNVAIRRFIRDVSPHVNDILDLADADITSMKPEMVRILQEKTYKFRERIRKLEIEIPTNKIEDILSGYELMEHFGYGPGKWIGVMKDYLMDCRLYNPNLTKEEAWKLADFCICYLPKELFKTTRCKSITK